MNARCLQTDSRTLANDAVSEARSALQCRRNRRRSAFIKRLSQQDTQHPSVRPTIRACSVYDDSGAVQAQEPQGASIAAQSLGYRSSRPLRHCAPAHTRKSVVACSASIAESFGDGSHSSRSSSSTLQTGLTAFVSNTRALYEFSRPHTMLGTFISICSVSLLAMGPSDFGAQALTALVQALVPALLMNICIVGMNQIFDVEIDKINKPYLPLASGDWSLQTGISVAVGTGLAAVLLSLYIGSKPLLATVVGSLLLGIAYSVDLPFLRWKKYPILAMGCILSVRAILVQLGFYFHMQQALDGSRAILTWPLLFAICFMLVFSVVIALFKDLPDIEGDRQADVKTLSVRLGPKRVFWACIVLLQIAYAGAIGLGALSQVWWSKLVTVGMHSILAATLLWRARQVDLQDTASITSCYMLVWKLFYSEYLLIPFFR